jgi:uroporphyrin-3 C-methyltransferase
MSDPAPTASPAAGAAASRRRPLPLALTVSLLALAGAGWSLWDAHVLRRDLADAERARQEQSDQLARLGRDGAEALRQVQALERRLADADGVNQSMREEVLGLGERARLLEDAVARLAERGMSGAVLLRLNEAEFLLRMGEERLALFGDAAATIAAFQLADAELAALEDPLFTGVRQRIAADIAALSALPRVDRSALLSRLDAVGDALPRLPTRTAMAAGPAPELAPTAGWFERTAAALARFVRVRAIGDGTGTLVNPLDADAARAAVAIELSLAKAAILVGDEPALRSATERARRQLAATFAGDAPPVQQALTALDAVLATPTQPAWPDVGGALVELRNLRATRALTEGVRPAPAPSAP